MDNVDLESVKSFVDTLWVIDCAILVFIMQAGFMCMETGLSRHKNSINVALKNAADFGVAVVIFWIFGFGLMFGTSWNGLKSLALDKSFRWDEWFWFGIVPALVPYIFYFIWRKKDE